MIEAIVITLILMAGLIYMQHRHYEHIERKEKVAQKEKSLALVEAHLKDLDDMKKRLDVLTLKAGFKL